jgi:glycosyltransferase involved in cell wall biosynthesis
VAARTPPSTIEASLASLAAQRRAAQIEVIVADGSPDGCMGALVQRYPGMRRVAVPGGNLPALKAAAIRAARGEWVAILDPGDAADPDWVDEMLAAFADPGVCAVGGAVVLSNRAGAANVAAYLFEYGAFNPPIEAGDTQGDLPGNNVAYRRSALTETCADLLASDGFYKPFVHERLRARGARLAIRPAMQVRHLTSYAFLDFGVRRFHYGRCFGALRIGRASPARKVLYRIFAPAVAPLLIARHLAQAWRHAPNRRLLPDAALALCGVCAFWGVGEWLGYWFGAGQSCENLY